MSAGAGLARLSGLSEGLRSLVAESRRRLGDEALTAPARWCRKELEGRLVELSGRGASASLTLAMKLVLDAQQEGENVAWIGATRSSFFAPDAAAIGVDLSALPVVRAPDVTTAARASCRLLRSGAFGLVVLDLGADARLATALQSRLIGLAQRHGAVVLFLTGKARSSPSLGSLISLRAHGERKRVDDGRFLVHLEALKDKRRGPGWSTSEAHRGPPGLR